MNAEDNFWDKYPDAGLVKVFRELREKKGERESSNLMWYIKCMHDVELTYLRHLPDDEREVELKKFYEIKENDLKLAYVKACREWYIEHWLAPTRRLLNSLSKKVFEAEALVRKEKMTTVEDIIKYGEVQKAFGTLKREYDAAEASFKEDKSPPDKRGSGDISAWDSGELDD